MRDKVSRIKSKFRKLRSIIRYCFDQWPYVLILNFWIKNIYASQQHSSYLQFDQISDQLLYINYKA